MQKIGTGGSESAIDASFTGHLTLPSTASLCTINRIGGNAFLNCEGLTSITIPNTIVSIEYFEEFDGSASPFTGCSNLTSIYSHIEVPFATDSRAFDGIPTNATLYVPHGTKQVYENTPGWNRFTSIVERRYKGDIMTAATTEGITMTFVITDEDAKTCQVGTGKYNASAIDMETSGIVTIPTSVEGFRVTHIANYAFSECANIEKVVIPEGIETMGYSVFDGCINLQSANFPNSLIEIDGDLPFDGCQNLKNSYC